MKEVNVNLMFGKIDKRKKEIPPEKIGISIKATIGIADHRASIIDTMQQNLSFTDKQPWISIKMKTEL